MAAPILHYDDCRLYGFSLTQPTQYFYSYTWNLFNSIHPSSYKIYECSVRTFVTLIGLVGMTLSSPLFLVGRSVQILNYHLLSKESLNTPQKIEKLRDISFPANIKNFAQLNSWEKCEIKKGQHGTSKDVSIQILRWGFDPQKTHTSSLLGNAAYMTLGKSPEAKIAPTSYGSGRIKSFLSLDEREIAYLNQTPSSYSHSFELQKNQFAQIHEKNTFDELDIKTQKVFMSAIRDLFLMNGYRALVYKLNTKYGLVDAIAVFDASRITIKKFKPSYAQPGKMAVAYAIH